MKVTFTYGNSVKIIVNQDNDGYYVYTPENITYSPIKFSSVRDAITFFSSILPVEAYDEDEHPLDFILTVECENKTIDFCMSHKDKTKIVWVDYNKENEGFSDFLSKNKKLDDTINDVVWYFIKWIKYTPIEEKKKHSKFAEEFFSRLDKERKYNATQNYYLQLSRLYI
jgi:hypothetical protein